MPKLTHYLTPWKALSCGIDKMLERNPPLIIIGMHRSGTSLSVQMLEKYGFRMGIYQTKNNESVLFQKLNRYLLTRIGMEWRCPDANFGVQEITREFRTLERSVMAQIHKKLFGAHLRLSDWLRKDSILWGFKDPRTTLTLPFWKNIFPYAPVMHIIRDGRDVALSLAMRDSARLNTRPLVTDRQIRQFRSDLKTWEDYVRRGREAMQLFDRTMEFRYEDLLKSPLETLERVSEQLELDLDTLGTANHFEVNVSRIGSFKNSEWFERIEVDSSLLKELGYL